MSWRYVVQHHGDGAPLTAAAGSDLLHPACVVLDQLSPESLASGRWTVYIQWYRGDAVWPDPRGRPDASYQGSATTLLAAISAACASLTTELRDEP